MENSKLLGVIFQKTSFFFSSQAQCLSLSHTCTHTDALLTLTTARGRLSPPCHSEGRVFLCLSGHHSTSPPPEHRCLIIVSAGSSHGFSPVAPPLAPPSQQRARIQTEPHHNYHHFTLTQSLSLRLPETRPRLRHYLSLHTARPKLP